MKQRHVRPGDDLRGDEVIVIRGGELDPAVLRSDALRYHSIYGTYGISVFAARDVTVDELAQQSPLVRFEVLTLVETAVLRAAVGRPPGRTPKAPETLGEVRYAVVATSCFSSSDTIISRRIRRRLPSLVEGAHPLPSAHRASLY